MFILAMGLLSLGCSDELQGEEILCDWFSEDNCWKQSLEAASACAHDPALEEGVLTADGKSCHFVDGTTISFRNPLDLQSMTTHLWDFKIERDQSFCLSFSEPSLEKRILETSLGIYVEELMNMGLQITCPDQQKYKVLLAPQLSTCDNPDKILPGLSIDWSDTAIRFAFTGGEDGKLTLFSCLLE